LEENNINHYYKNGLLIATISCSFKCLKEQDLPMSICQNSHIGNLPTMEKEIEEVIKENYINNPLQECIIFAGLEPLDQFEEVLNFVKTFRKYKQDDIVIYAGYNKDEIIDKVEILKQYTNIIIKFGRFIKDSEKIFDDVLKIKLASKNQYAVKIS
jgi:pyruvate-formate lyase-activating enzyme